MNTQTNLIVACNSFLQVANSAMCGPIRSLTEARGHHTADHQLASFGGAGGQHACAIAEALGIRRVTIHKYSSILSAYGIGLADVVHEEERACAKTYDAQHIPAILSDLDSLSEELQEHSSMRTFNTVDAHRFLNMRYDGSETAIMIALEDGLDAGKAFIDAHHQQFGFTPVNRKLFVDTIRVRVVGRQVSPHGSNIASTAAPTKILAPSASPATAPEPSSTKQVYFSSLGWADTPVYLFPSIAVGMVIQGPALVVDKTQTLLVGPSSTAQIVCDKLVMDVSPPQSHNISTAVLDPVALSVFRHRFMGVAEQMGRVLQNVSVSANIKERLDFSCAIFTPDGSLVANAPHVPAMIGSMAFAVKSQIKNWAGRLRDGDVILSNSPGELTQSPMPLQEIEVVFHFGIRTITNTTGGLAYGGTHLPDLTIVTPVFDAQGKEIIFWAASRGHHADVRTLTINLLHRFHVHVSLTTVPQVGGILPGSMPPNSKFLWEEGAVFDSFLLVRDGVFAEKELRRLLCEEPAKMPGTSGTRCFQDNVTDLKAQVAANHTGIRLVRQLIQEYTMDVVQVCRTFLTSFRKDRNTLRSRHDLY